MAGLIGPLRADENVGYRNDVVRWSKQFNRNHNPQPPVIPTQRQPTEQEEGRDNDC